jgi:hypothetical protein
LTVTDHFFDPLGLLAVGVLTAVLAFFQPLRTGARSLLSGQLFSLGRTVLPGVLGVLLVIAMVGITPIPDRASTSAQSELGLVVREEVPPGETVFVENGHARPFHTFSFYAQRPLRGGSLDELNGDESIEYAVVQADSRPALARDSTVIETMVVDGTSIALVHLDAAN